MSEELSTSFFSITGKTGRVSYFFQNSVLMVFGFQYIYGGYLSSAFLNMERMPVVKHSMDILRSMPMYSEMLDELHKPSKPDPSIIVIKLCFLLALRIVDLKRVRDILNRKLKMMETICIAVFFSIPFVDFLSTIMLVTLPPKKDMPSYPLKEAYAVDAKEAQRERLIKQNEMMFKQGKISRADFERARDKYTKP